LSKAQITVLKRTFQKDLLEREITDAGFRQSFEPCPIHREGQSFIAEGWPTQPEGFCPPAWADIRHEVEMVMHGATPLWIASEGKTVTCCNDGLRPVIFRIERIESEEDR